MTCRPTIDAVIVFDLDDTLYLERDYVESGLHAVGRWMERQLGIAHAGGAMVEQFRAGARGHLFDAALASAGVPDAEGLIPRMVQVYRQHRPAITLAEDAMRFLSHRPGRTGFAIITDGYLDAQRRKIRALGLHRLGVEIAVCTDRWGRQDWKPARRAFERVQSFFALPASAFAYVADNPEKDFVAPRRMGWRTVQINRPGRLREGVATPADPAEREIDSFDGLLA
ncbi:HAD family hydrolase [Sphingomonas sp. PR090111-T3T-6A]|uniref:HAD family hydrolase n=1 Tax=Sphingomonas sp. PR090111-T3T-6A TaxID=685778 RepID=UPI00037F16ED|nr:HAD family hydrolase [Sphingomonas sp. PR090111-T3T-6A]